nr:glycosyl hydrolase family 17 protein [Candidatus Krumholzibacteria bacterium]
MRVLISILMLPLLVGGCDGGSEAEFTVRPFEPLGVEAVCYGPHRDGQGPDGPHPSVAELREDLHLIASHWGLMRIYGATGPAEDILQIIHEDQLPLKVMLGIWIAPDAARANQDEISAGIGLAEAFPDIVTAVCVGNETQVSWSAHVSPLEDLIRHVRQVREAVTVPVTVADDYNYWNKPESQTLSPELDFITMHAHPLWNGLQLEQSVTWLDEQVTDIKSRHPDRLVVLGETGWATMVHNEGEQARLIKGAFGEAEQKVFFDEARAWARASKVTMFFFEVFDENWKGGPHPDEVEKHWGLYHADRTPKAALR